jgi:hypothetical protein
MGMEDFELTTAEKVYIKLVTTRELVVNFATFKHRVSSNQQVRVRLYMKLVTMTESAVNFATLKSNLVVKHTMFSHRKNKFTWTSPVRKAHSQIYHILTDRRRHCPIIQRDADHYLVVAKVRGRQAVGKKNAHIYYIWRDSISRN